MKIETVDCLENEYCKQYDSNEILFKELIKIKTKFCYLGVTAF